MPPILAIVFVVAVVVLYYFEGHAQNEDWQTHKQTRCMEVAERARSLWFDLHVMGFMREQVNDSEYLKDVAAEAESDRAAYDKIMGDCMGLNT